MTSAADYIIVGAGSSGCVLAAELSKDPGVRVVLLESGPPDNSLMIDMPRGIGKLLTPGDPRSWQYAVSKGGNRGEETWLKGRTLGGSSSINGMIYVRGHASDYDGWAAMGCTGWGWRDMLPCFMALEDHALGADSQRGAGGPLKISMQPAAELADAVIAAAGEAGLPRVEDINAAPDVCMGYPPRTIHGGVRQSAAKAFLRPAMKRPNLEVRTGTDVLRILFEGRRAAGVEIRNAAGAGVIRARREVILCAGSLQSPRILQLSGVGPGALLRSLGIEVIADSPLVGRNLREHLGIQSVFRVKRGSLNAEFAGLRLLANVMRYLLFKSGPMTYSASEFNGVFRSREGLPAPDCQIMGGLYSMARTDKGLKIEKEPGLTISGYYMHTKSQGEISIRSADPDAAPYVNANYLDAEEDRQAAIAVLRFFRKVAAQTALRPYMVGEILPGPAVQSDEELLNYVIETGATAFHVSGTCRMGADPQSVVDPQLKVRGAEGLRVVDTSIFPNLVSGNTNAPAMAAGLRAAQFIRGG